MRWPSSVKRSASFYGTVSERLSSAGVCGVDGDGATSCCDRCSGRSTAHTCKVSRRCVIACGLPGASHRPKRTGTGGSGEASHLCEDKNVWVTEPCHPIRSNYQQVSLTCVDSDVFNESCSASGRVVAVAALELPVIGPLKTIHQDPWTVLQGHVHWGVIQPILTAVCIQEYYQDVQNGYATKEMNDIIQKLALIKEINIYSRQVYFFWTL